MGNMFFCQCIKIKYGKQTCVTQIDLELSKVISGVTVYFINILLFENVIQNLYTKVVVCVL